MSFFIRHLLFLLLITKLYAVDVESYSTLLNYDKAQSNILAIVVGYQNWVVHNSGITIPKFSANDDAGKGEEHGVLFFIVAPTNYAGRLFFASCDKHSFSDAQITPSEKMFPKDVVLKFKLDDFPISLLEKSDCLEIINSPISTGHLAVQRYLPTTKEAVIYLEFLNRKIKNIKKEILELDNTMLKERYDVNSNVYNKAKAKKRTLVLQLQEKIVSLKDAEQQLQQLKSKAN